MKLMTAIKDALALTRSQRLMEATQRIQETLGQTKQKPHEIPKPFVSQRHEGKAARPLSEVIQTLQRMKKSSFPLGKGAPRPSTIEPEVISGAQFLNLSFSCDAGVRTYKLYVPKHKPVERRPLLIMLHGCKQNPSDFAIGTGMNALAEAHGMLVAYPAQTQTYNPSGCWNWFNPGHQHRGIGEPAIIAGLTSQIIANYDIDVERVFVAGLSAGGAMAVIMGETYAGLFSAVGVHSGLPYKSATDVVSAFAAMRGELHTQASSGTIRTIVFHGDADTTVAPSNAADIMNGKYYSRQNVHRGVSVSGKRYTREVFEDQNGISVAEKWIIQGAGHAWAGGHPQGSFTDKTGPDASREMLRFFLNP
jgi:poly(hydroxyalkanoate) depolymerase family esterase